MPDDSLTSAERLRSIVDAVSDGIITTDEDGTIESFNRAAERMFGRTAGDVVGISLFDLMPVQLLDDQGTHSLQSADVAPGHDTRGDQELLGRRADGSTFPIETAVSEMRPNGRLMFTAVVRDLTDRRDTEEKVRRLAALLDASIDAIKTIDLEGNIKAWNTGAERLYRYPAATALTMNARDLTPERRQGELRGMLERLTQGEYVPPFETQRVAADGELVHIVCTPTRIEGARGEPATVIITDRDITEQIRNEAALRDSEEKMRAIVRTAVDGVVTIDSSGIIESVNPAAERLFGYDKCELVGSNVSMLTPSPVREEHDHYLRRYLMTGVEKIIGKGREVVGQRKDGSLFPMELAISELRVGERRMFTGIVRDISERKRIEAELKAHADSVVETNRILQEASERARSATAAKSEFLANMSHEIRTPMTAILGYAELLLQQASTPQVRETVGTIQRNGEHLLAIINDILDLSKIEAGHLEVDHRACSPTSLLADVIGLMQIRADASGLYLRAESVTAIPDQVEMDSVRVRQILVNLVGNAIKFSPNGGVTVRVGYDGPGTVDRLWFEVEDTGIGLDEKQLAKVFAPFAQADTSSTRLYGGTGLGLTICRKLARLLGGDITATSEVGLGSTFRATFTVGLPDDAKLRDRPAIEAEQQPKARTKITPNRLKGRRVLVAEDGADNRRLIGSILSSAGAELSFANDGAQAIEAVERANEPFDVILMDMQMPVMDGYEATATLRDRDYTGLIVAVTAHAMTDDEQRCIDAGCDDYTTKPVQRARLVELVDSLVTAAEKAEGSEADGDESPRRDDASSPV